MSDPGETTRQIEVEAGDKTGIYHITLCNLPFGSTWKEVKDFLRLVCEVSHVEVFQHSTSGWVRVMGCHNFDQTLSRFRDDLFHGRRILACDKNRTERIKIKMLVDTSLEPVEDAYPVDYSMPMPPIEYSMGSCDTRSYDEYSQTPLIAYADYDPADGTYSAAQDSMWPDTYPDPSLPCDPEEIIKDNTNLFSVPSERPESERRNVLVRNIPIDVRPHQVSSWVKKKLGEYAVNMECMEVLRDDYGSEICAFAYIWFIRSAAAKEGARLLNGRRFKRRYVAAAAGSDEGRLLENEKVKSKSRSKAANDREKSEGRSHHHSASQGSADASSSSHGSRKKPSSDRQGGSSRDEKKDKKDRKERKEKKDPGPLIVNGTMKKRTHR